MLFQPPIFSEVLQKNDLELIHQSTLNILEKTGIVFENAQAREIFRHAGARLDGKKVFLPRTLVDESIGMAPSTFTLVARNVSRNLVIGGGDTVVAPAAGPRYMLEKDGKRREAGANDVVNFLKLVQTSDFLQMNGAVPVIPRDVSDESRPAFTLAASALFTDKPLPGFAHGKDAAQASLAISALLYGPETSGTVLAMVNSTTPLAYDEEETDGMMVFARAEQPLCITSCAMAGSTSPVTLAGTLTVCNAEILAGIVLVQLVNPGNPVIYGNLSSISDMKNMSFASGAPEFALLLAAAAQLARFYRLPFRGGGGLTDAKAVDVQAGYETMLNLLSTYASGTDYCVQATGIVDSLLTVSLEKFIVDEEIGLMVKRLVRGFEISPDTVAVDLIAEKGPRGQFLDTAHTARNFRREFFQPRLSNRQQFNTWESEGSQDILDRAERLWRQRLESYQVPDLEPKVKEKLLSYLSKNYPDCPLTILF